MQQKRNLPQSSRSTTASPPTLELPPDRAFVLHLDARAQPLSCLIGRVEHVTSGQKAYVTSVRELVVFLAKVVRKRNRAG